MEPAGQAVEHTPRVDIDGAETALERLATFPEDNPNLVIETDLEGAVSYANPVARHRFPDLEERGADHPVLGPLSEIVPQLLEGDGQPRSCEIVIGPATFEAKICVAAIGDRRWIRVYAHDVTAMRNAERTVHELASRVVRAQEEERRRISRELHDEAGQALTALKIGLRLVQRDEALDADTLRENIDEAIALVEETHERIRSLAHGLRPAALDAVGLSATLDDLCRQFAMRTGLTISFVSQNESAHAGESPAAPDLPDDVQICLYRLVQEALTNCAVHAGSPAHVEVRLHTTDDRVVLTVVDDGHGVDADVLDATGRSGFGLVGMQERIELLAGQLEVESAPGRGFRLTATVPLFASRP